MNEYIDGVCPACKFWLWFEERHEYGCSIKGCWRGSKFKEFTLEGMIKEIENERKKRTF